MRSRTTVEPGGKTATGMPVPPDVVEALGAGDEVDVEVELDGDEAARATFEALPYSHKQRHVLAIEGATTPETRARRIDKALELLRSGP